MIRSLIFTGALLLSLGISASAQDINGKWKGSAESPQGNMELIFNFVPDGQNLTGTITSDMGEMQIENGKIDDKKFSFDLNFNDFTITHQCEIVSNDSIRVKTDMMEMMLTRVKDSE